MSQENRRMPNRLAVLVATLGAAVMLLALLPAASVAASPWWQILDGSRPSNMWEPRNQVQELQAKPQPFVVVSLEEVPVACMFSPFCSFLGLPNSETAQQLEEALESPSAYGAGNVEVVEEAGGSRRFLITSIGEDAGHAVPALSVNEPSTMKTLVEGGSGRLILTLTNLGNAPVDGTETPVTIVDELPGGVIAEGVEASAGWKDESGPVDCAVEAADLVTCNFEGTLPPYEAIEIDVLASLTGSPPATGAPGRVTVSGGNAPSKSIVQEIEVSPEEVRFGIERFSAQPEEEGGDPAIQAGGHPFQLTTTIQFNAGNYLPGKDRTHSSVEQPALPRNLHFPLPAGLVGSATAVPYCEMPDFYERLDEEGCPAETALGVASVTIFEETFLGGFARLAVPVFNLPPKNGEPARFGFNVLGTPVLIGTAVDPDNGYRIVASVSNATQLAKLLSSTVVIWGDPGDPEHDATRGWGCVFKGKGTPQLCERPPALSEEAFLRQPVSCQGPLGFGVEAEPWNVPPGSVVERASFAAAALFGCNQVPFDPTIAASPTSKSAVSSSGLEFRLDMPNSGLANGDAVAEGQAKKVEVTLPEGVTVNPSQAEGLGACSPADYARETVTSPSGQGCPESSKIGNVQISTPLLEEEAKGSLYVAKPYDNPLNSLIALYMVAKIPERGVLVKQAGKVALNPSTGQLVTTFDNLPQLPFDTFRLNFFEGDRAPLVMPAKCGAYEMVAKFTPWSASDPNNPLPSEIITRSSSFTIDRGANGAPCPSGIPPFKPGFTAGTTNNAAGDYSPFVARLTRSDGEQEFSRFSMKLPKGVIGKVAGIPFCSETAIAAARARTGPNGGQEELDTPSCPAASQIGRTLVGAGVGPTLSYAPGKIYLAGPYQGSKLSIVAISTAKVGPFDLGTVVIRQALRVDPETAEVSTDGLASEPIPHILQGIVVHARDIRIIVDRPEFVLNPTSCERMTTDSTVLGSGLDLGSLADDQAVSVSSPFQAADCASLGFKPKLSLKLFGGTKRGDTPRLRAILTARKGDANIGRAQVTLSPSSFLEQAHIRTICTRVQFRAGGGNGEKCPKASIYGRARAISPLLDEPLSGPVFLRSSNNELPDLVAAMHSSKVDINLVGRIDSINQRIRTTFDRVPDAPVTKFVLNMQGGSKGLIVNNTNICRGKHRAIANFKGQNGRRHLFKPLVKAQCGGKKKGAKGGKRSTR
jgi:hypothetical protein